MSRLPERFDGRSRTANRLFGDCLEGVEIGDAPAARVTENGPRRFKTELTTDGGPERVPEPIGTPRRDLGATACGGDRFRVRVR